MIPQIQKYRHQPSDGVYGDCHRTAIACILDMYLEDVPECTKEMFENLEKFHAVYDGFLASKGLRAVNIAYTGTLAQVLEMQQKLQPDTYYILGGTSRNGCGHSVVGCGGEIVWDPALDDSGIVSPQEDGYYWVTYFISNRFLRRTHV